MILAVLSNLPKGQVELKVGPGKICPMDKCISIFFSCPVVPVRTSVDLCYRNELNNGLYQVKVDVGMLNTVKSYFR